MREETVSINGVLYNAKTGQIVKQTERPRPITKPDPKKVLVRQPKKIIVKATPSPIKQRASASQTLNRQFVKKPVATKKINDIKPVTKKPVPKNTVTKMVNKKPPISMPPKIAYRGVKRPKPVQNSAPKTPVQIQAKPPKAKKSWRTPIITIAVLLVIITGIVLSYLFLPSFSVWVASQRSGVDATLPVYTPTGYKVAGVAESGQGLVTINYYSKGFDNSYSLTQTNSNWDSTGVLENKVKPLGGSHQTLTQKGLTIYRYSTGAIWINGGVLYTISDEGKLSNEQILHIVDGI